MWKNRLFFFLIFEKKKRKRKKKERKKTHKQTKNKSNQRERERVMSRSITSILSDANGSDTPNPQSIPALTAAGNASVDPEMFPTPPSTNFFPFVQEDDEGKLFPLIASYLTIGEFELAKGMQ